MVTETEKIGCIDVLLNSVIDTTKPRYGNFEEKFIEFHMKQKEPHIKKNFDDMVDIYANSMEFRKRKYGMLEKEKEYI